MGNGLENTPDETITKIAGNIKSGIHRVFQMSPEEQTRGNGHDVPPLEWAKTVMMILQPFREEIERRGLNYKNIQPDISQYEDVWAEIHLKENQ
jgi:hypothetical protein